MSEKKDERLAKLYLFLEDGDWKEECMGVILIRSDDSDGKQFIVILDPANEDVELRRIPIRSFIQYQANDKCLIQWSEDADHEYALSFLTEKHRDEIMADLQKEEEKEQQEEKDWQDGNDSQYSQMLKEICSSKVSTSTFKGIVDKLATMMLMRSFATVSLLLEDNGKLVKDLLQEAEYLIDLDDVEPVHLFALFLSNLSLHGAVKSTVVNIGNKCITDLLFDDDCYLQLFGVFDYYNDTYQTNHAEHRRLFESRVKYHSVIDFQDDAVLHMIHITFRMIYFRDAVCPEITNILQESRVNIPIRENYQNITKVICEKTVYADKILELLQPEKDDSEVAGLLYEMFYAPGFIVQTETMNLLMKAFCGVVWDPESEDEIHVEEGKTTLMEKIEAVLTAGKQSQKTAEKLLLLLERVCKMNPQYCWSTFCANSPSAHRLLEFLISSCLAGAGGVQESSYQVLAELLLPETTGDMAHLVFVRFFYNHFMHALTDGFVARDETVPLSGQLHVLELLAECLPRHQSSIQLFLKDGALLQALLECLPADTPRRSCSLLRAAVVRLLERGVEMKGDWFADLLAEKGLMRFVFAVADRGALEKNTLLSSAVLHFFSLLLAGHRTALMRQCAQKAKELGVEAMVPFSKILAAVEGEEVEEAPRVKVEEARTRIREELDEEAYFDSVDEEEEMGEEEMGEPAKTSLLPSFEEKKEEEFSMDSFFGAGVKESSRKNIHIDIKLLDTADKRVKLDS